MTPWRMHSMTFMALRSWKINGIEYRSDPGSRNGVIPTFAGRDVIVDDREPRNQVVEELEKLLQ